MEEGQMLTMGEDWSVPLITEVCIFHSSNNHAFIHSFFLNCSVIFLTLFSGLAENSLSCSHSQEGRSFICGCYAATWGSTFGVSSFWAYQFPCREIAVITFLDETNCTISLCVHFITFSTSSPTIPIVGVNTPMPEKTSDDKTGKSVTMAPGP